MATTPHGGRVAACTVSPAVSARQESHPVGKGRGRTDLHGFVCFRIEPRRRELYFILFSVPIRTSGCCHATKRRQLAKCTLLANAVCFCSCSKALLAMPAASAGPGLGIPCADAAAPVLSTPDDPLTTTSHRLSATPSGEVSMSSCRDVFQNPPGTVTTSANVLRTRTAVSFAGAMISSWSQLRVTDSALCRLPQCCERHGGMQRRTCDHVQTMLSRRYRGFATTSSNHQGRSAFPRGL